MQAGRGEAKEALRIGNWNLYYPQITQIPTDYKTEEETAFSRLLIKKLVII